MGSYVKQIPNDEAFWTGLVETNLRLGWERCLVPLENLKPEVANALANRLNVKLEVTNDGYIFAKDEMWIRPKENSGQHHSFG